MTKRTTKSRANIWVTAGAALVLVGTGAMSVIAAPPSGTTGNTPPGTATGTTTPGSATGNTGTTPTPTTGPTFPRPTGTANTNPHDPGRAEAGTGTAGTVNDPSMRPAGAPSSLNPKESKTATRILNDLHKTNAKEIALGRLAQDRATTASVKEYAQMLVTDHESADKKVMDFAQANAITLTSATTTRREQPTTATDTGLRRPATTTPGAGAATDTATTTGTTGTMGTRTSPGAVAGTSAPGTAGGSVSDQSPTMELDPEARRTMAKLEKLEGTKFEKAFLTEMVRGHARTAAKLKAAERQTKSTELQTLLGDIRTSVEGHLEKAKAIQKGGAS